MTSSLPTSTDCRPTQLTLLLRQAGLISSALAVTALFAAAAQAGVSDTFTPFVSATYSYDDNLFRAPDTAAGSVQGDHSRALIGGVSFLRAVGRQEFSGYAKVTQVSFDRFDQLNYNGKDFLAKWRWQVGNDFDGTIGGNYLQTLSSFSDFRSTERNLHTASSAYVDGGWRVFPHWRVRGRVSRDKSEYDLLSQQYLDRTDDASEVGIDYLASTRSSIGLMARRVKGDYTNPLILGPLIYDLGYTQDEVKLKVVWNFDAITQLQFLGGPTRRNYGQLANRDASGTNARLTANWQVRPTIWLSGGAYREFAAYEGGYFSYSLNTGRSLNLRWNPAYRWMVEGEVRQVKRDFSELIVGTSSLRAHDDTRSQSLGLTYVPRDNFQLGLSVFHETRTGVAGFLNPYRTKGASFSVTAQF